MASATAVGLPKLVAGNGSWVDLPPCLSNAVGNTLASILEVLRTGPGDLAVFYDPLSYSAFDHPYEVYRQLRDQAPVYYNARRDLFVVSRYHDVRACLRNHEQMVNALGNDMDGTHDFYGPGNLIALDQPYHTVLRGVVRPSFAPREIAAMEDHIRENVPSAACAAAPARRGGFRPRTLPFPWCSGGPSAFGRRRGQPFWQEHL